MDSLENIMCHLPFILIEVDCPKFEEVLGRGYEILECKENGSYFLN